MIQRLGMVCSAWAQRLVPNPFVFAILLTFVAFVAANLLTDAKPWAVVDAWQRGFWELLSFAMQMCLILVTGHALASTSLVGRLLAALARLPRSTGGAAALVAGVAMLAALLNWGFGLIVGALFAREVARRGAERGMALHYPLVVAAGYTGLLIWHGGYSGSAPLSVATPDHFLVDQLGIIGVERTLLGPLNLVMSATLLCAVPLCLRAMAPPAGVTISTYDPDRHGDAPAARPAPPRTPAERLEQSAVLGIGMALVGLAWVVRDFAGRGLEGLNLNSMNMLFLFLGMLLHARPLRYVQALDQAVRGVAGILLQFPFYAGIMGIMKYTGLVAVISSWFVSAARSLGAVGVPTAATLSISSFLSAGLVNVFVPSGGGQWAVQGPVLVEAALELGVPIEKMIMAMSYGDEWTNMLQPFWALPLLGITGLKGRDIIGYTAALMLLVAPLMAAVLVVF